jgi:predicted polyphosphate/ATP-dependent NAD kinase
VGLDNIVVVATESKLRRMKSLRVDTGDSELDVALRERKLKVVADYKIEYTLKVE